MLSSFPVTINRQRNPLCRVNSALAILLLLSLTLAPQRAANAQTTQTFNSGSNGSDGALNITQSGIFDPRAFNPRLDPDGDNVFHFTTITIAAGVIVTLTSQIFHGPVIWLATGSVQISGTIDISGENGYSPDDFVLGSRALSIPGPGGYPGGVGQRNSSPSQAGSGPGGGYAPVNSDGCGAGHSSYGFCELTPSVSGYGNPYIVPLIGGSGGGGANTNNNSLGAGGGAGGGALLIASTTRIQIDGSIVTKGGNTIVNGPSYHAGGGSGGSIHLLAPNISGIGKLDASEGVLINNRAYAAGSQGRIRLDAFQHNFTGASIPTAVLGTPVTVPLTDSWPKLRIVNVSSVAAPSIPTGEHGPSDLTITSSSSVTVTVEARNVPVGQRVKLYVYSENAADQVFESTPLVGTLAQSTATISATIPYGPSRLFLRSDWTP